VNDFCIGELATKCANLETLDVEWRQNIEWRGAASGEGSGERGGGIGTCEEKKRRCTCMAQNPNGQRISSYVDKGSVKGGARAVSVEESECCEYVCWKRRLRHGVVSIVHEASHRAGSRHTAGTVEATPQQQRMLHQQHALLLPTARVSSSDIPRSSLYKVPTRRHARTTTSGSTPTARSDGGTGSTPLMSASTEAGFAKQASQLMLPNRASRCKHRYSTIHYAPYTMHHTLCTIHYAPYTMQCDDAHLPQG
jgi:hypothetical protein